MHIMKEPKKNISCHQSTLLVTYIPYCGSHRHGFQHHHHHHVPNLSIWVIYASQVCMASIICSTALFLLHLLVNLFIFLTDFPASCYELWQKPKHSLWHQNHNFTIKFSLVWGCVLSNMAKLKENAVFCRLCVHSGKLGQLWQPGIIIRVSWYHIEEEQKRSQTGEGIWN